MTTKSPLTHWASRMGGVPHYAHPNCRECLALLDAK